MKKVVTYDSEKTLINALWANVTTVYNLATVASWDNLGYIIEDGRVVGHEEEVHGIGNCIELIADRIKSAISRRIHRTGY